MTTIYLLLGLWVQLLSDARAFVIAPPWANQVVNPCSKKSWQLILWPENKKCYQIFQQGPCPSSQELAFDKVNMLAVCRCPKDLLYWPESDSCYPEFSKGPCQHNQYLERVSSSGEARCSNVKRCDNGWIFWPSEKSCHQLYTQGPCHKGDLLIMNPLTAEPYCGCDPVLLHQYFFRPLGLCYEHFTRGPCESGLLFAYNHTARSTHCLCSGALEHYHAPSQRCFQFGTKGPCKKGQIFALNEDTGEGECSCKDGYLFWPKDGQCYKSYTPGPCRPKEFIVPGPADDDQGRCVLNPCPRAHLYFPGEGGSPAECHKVGSRGPCELGELVVFERHSGKSYRGECGCSPGYNQNYWPETGKCYEWYTQGPCSEGFLFHYAKRGENGSDSEGGTECVCDDEEGFVYWNETQACYRVYTQGPCPDHAWLIPGEKDVFCECRTGYFFDSESYTCQDSLPQALLYSIGSLAKGASGASTWSLLERMRRPRNHKFQGEEDKALAAAAAKQEEEQGESDDEGAATTTIRGWAEGVFVTPGHTGIAGRVSSEGATRRRGSPEYTWEPTRLRDEELVGDGEHSRASTGWGAKALPRVSRLKRRRRQFRRQA